jgi:hypothetical protein
MLKTNERGQRQRKQHPILLRHKNTHFLTLFLWGKCRHDLSAPQGFIAPPYPCHFKTRIRGGSYSCLFLGLF